MANIQEGLLIISLILLILSTVTIFGGLFLGGTFILYEWGINPINESNASVGDYRYFGAILAVLICCNIFLTLWSSILWLSAIVYGSHKDFVYGARKLIGFCSGLLGITVITITAGCISAIQINLGNGNPEFILLTVFVILLQMTGVHYFNYMNLTVAPLAISHVPELLRVFYCPSAALTATGREKLKMSSKEQGNNLLAKVNAEREKLNAEKDLINSDISLLLRTAATNLGRENHDISIYVNRLKDEWFDDPKQLLGESVVLLSRHMPYMLAKELHRLVEAEFLESNIYRHEK